MTEPAIPTLTEVVEDDVAERTPHLNPVQQLSQHISGLVLDSLREQLTNELSAHLSARLPAVIEEAVVSVLRDSTDNLARMTREAIEGALADFDQRARARNAETPDA